MSILTIAQNVAKETGFNPPSSVVGSTDEIAIQLLALIKRETQNLSNLFEWQALRKRATLTLVNGTEAYPISTVASDFKEYIPKTAWDYSTRRPVIVPLSPQDYEIQKNYFITSGIDKMFYIYNSTIYITPTPTAADVIHFEYITTNIYLSSSGVPKAAITVDTDTTAIPEFLVELGVKLRYLVAKGEISSAELDSSFEKRDYYEQVTRAIERDGFGQKNPISMLTNNNPYWLAAYVQDSNFPSS
jgi:hypothetical protein